MHTVTLMQELEWGTMHGRDAGTVWLQVPSKCLGKAYPAHDHPNRYSANCLVTGLQVDGGFQSIDEAKEWLLGEVQRWITESQDNSTLPDKNKRQMQTEVVRTLFDQLKHYGWFRFFGIGVIDGNPVIYVYCSSEPPEEPIKKYNGHRLIYQVVDDPIPAT
jgi:hypothetical protein